MPKFLFKFIVNGLALFSSVVGLYFALESFSSLPQIARLLLTLGIGAFWGLKSMMYFRGELLKLIASNLKGKDLTKVSMRDILS